MILLSCLGNVLNRGIKTVSLTFLQFKDYRIKSPCNDARFGRFLDSYVEQADLQGLFVF